MSHAVKITVPAGAVSEDIPKFYLQVRAVLNKTNVVNKVFSATDNTFGPLASDTQSYNPNNGVWQGSIKTSLRTGSATVVYLFYS